MIWLVLLTVNEMKKLQIAWILVLAVIGVSLFFIWVYGIEFGESKARKWLTSFLMSTLTSILVTYPLKLFCLAVFCTYVCAKTGTEEDRDLDEEQLQYQPMKSEYGAGIEHDENANQLSEDILHEDRMMRLKEKRMWALLVDLLINVFFAIIVLAVAYGGRDVHSFHYRQSQWSHYNGDWNHVHPDVRFMNVREKRCFSRENVTKICSGALDRSVLGVHRQSAHQLHKSVLVQRRAAH